MRASCSRRVRDVDIGRLVLGPPALAYMCIVPAAADAKRMPAGNRDWLLPLEEAEAAEAGRVGGALLTPPLLLLTEGLTTKAEARRSAVAKCLASRRRRQ